MASPAHPLFLSTRQGRQATGTGDTLVLEGYPPLLIHQPMIYGGRGPGSLEVGAGMEAHGRAFIRFACEVTHMRDRIQI